MGIDIEEISVYVKTYKTYTHMKDIHFVGQRDFSFLETLWVGDLLENPFTGLDESTYSFITHAYNYNPIYEKRLEEGYYEDNWEPQGETGQKKEYDKLHETNHDHNLRTDLTDEEKNRVYTIVLSCLSNFKGDKNNKQSIHYKINHCDIFAPSKNGIKNVQKGRYLDIFRRSADNKVFLRAEYYFDGSNWCEVSIKELKTNRVINYSSASEVIKIPANQTCYMMLSDIEQAPQRLEALRKKLEDEKPKIKPLINEDTNWIEQTKLISSNVSKNNEPCFTVPSDVIHDSRLRALEIPIINEKLKQKMEKCKYSQMQGYNNIIYENSSTPTVIVTDFIEYAESLFTSLTIAYNTYLNKTGADMSINEKYLQQSLDQEKTKDLKIILPEEHNQNLLRYLSELVCDRNKKWDLLNSKGKEKNPVTGFEKEVNYQIELKNELKEIRTVFGKVYYLVDKLSWWICQSPYQDMLYDYEYYYYYVEKDADAFDNMISERFEKYLLILENITVANEALEYLYKDASIKAYRLFSELNKIHEDEKLSETELQEQYKKYILGEESKIKDDFKLLQSYELMHETNWLLEIFYPKLKKPIKDGYLKVLGIFSHIIVQQNGKKYQGTELIELLYRFLSNCTNTKLDFYIRDFDNERVSIILKNGGYKPIKILYFTESDRTKHNIVENIASNKYYSDAVKYALSAIDQAVILYKLSEQKKGSDAIEFVGCIAEDIVKLTKVNDSIKNTWLGNIKLNGNRVFSDYSGLISLATSFATMFYYIYEGDLAYAIADFSCDVICLALTVAFGGIYVTIAMIFVNLLTDIIIKNLKTDDFEKWVTLNNYGCDHELLSTSKQYPNKWKNNIYKNYVADLYHTDIKKDTAIWYNSISQQVKTYYKIQSQIKSECLLYKRYYDELEEYYGNYYVFCVELKMKIFFQDDKVKLQVCNKLNGYKYLFTLEKKDLNVTVDKNNITKCLMVFTGGKRNHDTRIMEDIARDYSEYKLKPENIIKIQDSNMIKSLVELSKKNMWTRYLNIIIEYYSSYNNTIGDNSPFTSVSSGIIPIKTIQNAGV